MRLFFFLKNNYRLLSEKRFTTLAGTLVFFFMTSVMPLAVWLMLLFGKFSYLAKRIIEMPVFSSVEGVLSFFIEEAAKQRKSASVFLLATALYSATGLFYHLRKIGELVYGYKRKQSGWKLRLFSALFLFVVLSVSVCSVALVAGGGFLFSRFFPSPLSSVCTYLFMMFVSFMLVLLLNVYACPYRVRVRFLFSGSFVTAVSWTGALLLFSVYFRYGNVGRLYGALSAVVAFMLWLYALSVCFVARMIFNWKRLSSVDKKQTKTEKFWL